MFIVYLHRDSKRGRARDSNVKDGREKTSSLTRLTPNKERREIW